MIRHLLVLRLSDQLSDRFRVFFAPKPSALPSALHAALQTLPRLLSPVSSIHVSRNRSLACAGTGRVTSLICTVLRSSKEPCLSRARMLTRSGRTDR